MPWHHRHHCLRWHFKNSKNCDFVHNSNRNFKGGAKKYLMSRDTYIVLGLMISWRPGFQFGRQIFHFFLLLGWFKHSDKFLMFQYIDFFFYVMAVFLMFCFRMWALKKSFLRRVSWYRTQKFGFNFIFQIILFLFFLSLDFLRVLISFDENCSAKMSFCFRDFDRNQKLSETAKK